jgi:hypothetical protein
MSKATHTIAMTVNSPSGQITIGSFASTDEGNFEFEIDVPAGTTNQKVDFNILLAAIKSFVAVSSVAVTLKANDTADPDGTLALVAGRGYGWSALMPQDFFVEAVPSSVDELTCIYVTNATETAAVVVFRVLADVTPDN